MNYSRWKQITDNGVYEMSKNFKSLSSLSALSLDFRELIKIKISSHFYNYFRCEHLTHDGMIALSQNLLSLPLLSNLDMWLPKE